MKNVSKKSLSSGAVESEEKMGLRFDDKNYKVLSVTIDGETLIYRAFENIPYVENPESEIQKLSIYAPESYFEDKAIRGYDLKSAPIFLPNTVGGYMPGPQERPGKNFMGEVNATFYALLHGYVTVSAGVRGRTLKDSEGNYIGTAPAAVCDLKAAIRFLRRFKDRIPGDTEKIISNGTSAGGALSSLLAATGNHPEYEPFLKEMGAAEERDNVFAASCYCPITNLDHADMAYEWEFCGLDEYHSIKFDPPAEGELRPRMTPEEGVMDEERQTLSRELKKAFPAYVNSLHLADSRGVCLKLDENGNGTFKDFVCSIVKKSLQKKLDEDHTIDKKNWFSVEQGQIKEVDFDKYVAFRTRMKKTPAFDGIALETAENELFGFQKEQARHFTEFGKAHGKKGKSMADPEQIRLMNPMNYIGDSQSDMARHVRIRHGMIDRDTSLSISALLYAAFQNQGVDTQILYPWGRTHSGDYDLPELFEWIDRICTTE